MPVYKLNQYGHCRCIRTHFRTFPWYKESYRGIATRTVLLHGRFKTHTRCDSSKNGEKYFSPSISIYFTQNDPARDLLIKCKFFCTRKTKLKCLLMQRRVRVGGGNFASRCLKISVLWNTQLSKGYARRIMLFFWELFWYSPWVVLQFCCSTYFTETLHRSHITDSL